MFVWAIGAFRRLCGFYAEDRRRNGCLLLFMYMPTDRMCVIFIGMEGIGYESRCKIAAHKKCVGYKDGNSHSVVIIGGCFSVPRYPLIKYVSLHYKFDVN